MLGSIMFVLNHLQVLVILLRWLECVNHVKNLQSHKIVNRIV